MNALPVPASTPTVGGISIQDIFYVLFRQKWKILICIVLGLAAATATWFLNPPPYQSNAMLFIRYVMENSTPGPLDSGARTMSPDMRGETIMQTEIEILSSLDIAETVADTITPDKLLPAVKDPKLRTREHAAAVVRANLIIQPLPGSSVIQLIYKNTDPSLVQPVLIAVVDAYKKKHIEVHGGNGAVGDFLSQETDQFRSRLAQTESDLLKAQEKAGIVSIADAQKNITAAEDRIQQEITATAADIAEREAVYQSMVRMANASNRTPPPGAAASTAPAAPAVVIPPEDLLAYRQALGHLDQFTKELDSLSLQFTDQSAPVIQARKDLATAQNQKQALEKKYPTLADYSAARSAAQSAAVSPGVPLSNGPSPTAIAAAAAQLNGLQAKLRTLNLQLKNYQIQERKVDEQVGPISELERQKDLDEANYKYYSTHLEASRIDDALGAGRALNIAEIEQPTQPAVDYSKVKKLVGEIAGGGLALGMAWAFVIEFYWDHSLRRPKDVESKLGVPLFLSMPKFEDNGGANRHVFHETLRDRLISYFESQGLTHKPKLVAITGVGKNSGVTTTATGLAQSLSETHDGNVLLVDMTQSQGSAQQFSNGKAICGFDELLETRNSAHVQDNLYVVGAEPNDDKLSRALPTRFQRLIPKLKASDFDYIIFDMPAVNQISITPRLAQFMDMVLLVVESEHTDRELAKQATALLAQSRTHVGAVLNKTINYVPSRAHHEFLGST